MPELSEPVRVSFVVPRDYRELVRDAADYLGMSMSELIRVAIYEFVERHAPARRPVPRDWSEWRRLWESRHYSLMVEFEEQALRLAKSPDLAWRDDLEDVELKTTEGIASFGGPRGHQDDNDPDGEADK